MSDIDNNKNGISNKGRIRSGFEDDRTFKSDKYDIKRLSQDEEDGRIAGGARNVAATLFLRGYEEAVYEKQEDRLIEWAKDNHCLFSIQDIEDEFGVEIFDDLQRKYGAESPSSGTESCIYKYDDNHLLKVMRYNVFDTKPLGFLDNRIALHNYLFPGTSYELIGICRRGKVGKFSFVLKQTYIIGTRPTQYEIHKEMTKDNMFARDFLEETTYYSRDYIIRDLHTGNWIKGKNGKMYCIDPAPSFNISRKYNNM